MLFPRVDDGVPPITAQWPVKDIVYVAIVGTVMLAALLEWILWLLAFLYCLAKVFQKATDEGRWSIRILCILNSIFFIGMRCVFLPIMVVTLPLPLQIVKQFPEELVSILQWFAFYSFAALLSVPWLFCVYQLVTHNVGRTRRIKSVLDEHSAPKVVICMPCYKARDLNARRVDAEKTDKTCSTPSPTSTLSYSCLFFSPKTRIALLVAFVSVRRIRPRPPEQKNFGLFGTSQTLLASDQLTSQEQESSGNPQTKGS